MCVCVCYGEVAASISSLANWCMVLCIYIFICKCTNVHIKIVWVCCIHPAKLQQLRSLILCFLVSASSAAAPSDRLAAVRIEGIKGEVSAMSKTACFPLSQLRTNIVHPLARYGLGQV